MKNIFNPKNSILLGITWAVSADVQESMQKAKKCRRRMSLAYKKPFEKLDGTFEKNNLQTEEMQR